MTKIEEVAQSIYETAWGLGSWHSPPLDYIERKEAFEQARAAVEAMRKPGKSAIKSGVEYRLNTTIGGENRWPDDTAALWETMIDAILNENDV